MIKPALQRPIRNNSVTNALIALGSNLPRDTALSKGIVIQAVAEIARRFGSAPQLSRFYATPAFPPGSGPDFVNAALVIPWADTPEALLDLLHEIEEAFGRTRTDRWEARVLDLDLIALGQAVRPDAETQAEWRALPLDRAAQETPGTLILPHPRLQERAFVLVPLADVAPDWRHPLTGESVREMLEALPAEDLAEIRPIEGD